MEDSKLFKMIWRFNAILIAVAGVLAVGFLVLAMAIIAKDNIFDNPEDEVVNLNQEENTKEVFRLGDLVHVQGSGSAIVPLDADHKSAFDYSESQSSVSARNLLFVNLNSGTGKWLFANNSYLISSYRLLRASDFSSEEQKVIAILYYVIKSDTDGDKKLTERDDFIAAISKPDGSNYQEVLNGEEELLGHEVIGQDTIAILVSLKNKSYIRYIDIEGSKKIRNIELPKSN